MPFSIVRNDITKMKVDAIVNTANPAVTYGSGTDTAVYTAAGEDDLLKARAEIGDMDEGEVAITPGFKLPCKYIIHAVSPLWVGGDDGEAEKLANCYSRSLVLAKDNDCESIAFPLISTGGYGYPKEEAMQIAIREISTFLIKEDMDVYLVVFDHESHRVSQKLFSDIYSFIDDEYVYEQAKQEYYDAEFYNVKSIPDQDTKPTLKGNVASSLDSIMKQDAESFQEMLFRLIAEKGMSNTDVYKRANIGKKLFSKIKNNPGYNPKKETAVALSIALKLDMNEMTEFLARAGIALSPSNKFDLFIQYFVTHKVYDIYKINFALFDYELPLIGNFGE